MPRHRAHPLRFQTERSNTRRDRGAGKAVHDQGLQPDETAAHQGYGQNDPAITCRNSLVHTCYLALFLNPEFCLYDGHYLPQYGHTPRSGPIGTFIGSGRPLELLTCSITPIASRSCSSLNFANTLMSRITFSSISASRRCQRPCHRSTTRIAAIPHKPRHARRFGDMFADSTFPLSLE